jgi:hypothetical protein
MTSYQTSSSLILTPAAACRCRSPTNSKYILCATIHLPHTIFKKSYSGNSIITKSRRLFYDLVSRMSRTEQKYVSEIYLKSISIVVRK